MPCSSETRSIYNGRISIRSKTGLLALATGLAVLLISQFLAPKAFCETAKDLFFSAQRCYDTLRQHPDRQKYRDQWLRCIDGFKAVYRMEPEGPWAAAGMFMAGQLYEGLYQRSIKSADKAEAVDHYQRIIKRFPTSAYRKKAEAALASLQPAQNPSKASAVAKKGAPVVEKADILKNAVNPAAGQPPPPSAAAGPKAASLPAKAVVTGLRYWSNPNYSRVVIDTDHEISFTHRLLKPDPTRSKPPRLYVDLAATRLAKGIDRKVPIDDELLIDTRAGQYTPDSVRVVVDLKSFRTYKIFSLQNPFRVIIDVWGNSVEAAKSMPNPAAPVTGSPKSLGTSALARQLALGVSRIVIDPGHGGHDYGAPGYKKGVYEKNVTLEIAQKLAKKLKKELGCQIIMTRDSDRYLTLEERTAIANTKNADLFISIHANASRDHLAHGVETYFLNLATDNDSILVAARENATSAKNISDLQSILNDLMQNAKINESSRLAGYVQQSLYDDLRQHYSQIRNKGVKQAPFYVLLGAQMPAILVETSFISNPTECSRLTSASYQDQICDGIAQGVEAYIRDTNPTAMLYRPSLKMKKGGG